MKDKGKKEITWPREFWSQASGLTRVVGGLQWKLVTLLFLVACYSY